MTSWNSWFLKNQEWFQLLYFCYNWMTKYPKQERYRTLAQNLEMKTWEGCHRSKLLASSYQNGSPTNQKRYLDTNHLWCQTLAVCLTSFHKCNSPGPCWSVLISSVRSSLRKQATNCITLESEYSLRLMSGGWYLGWHYWEMLQTFRGGA